MGFFSDARDAATRRLVQRLGESLAPAEPPLPPTAESMMADTLEQARREIEQLSEGRAEDAAAMKMAQRRLEDMAYRLLDAMANNDDLPAETRKRIRRRAFRYWQEDPVLGSAVDLFDRYTFGRGLTRPSVPMPKDVEDGADQTNYQAPDKPVSNTSDDPLAVEGLFREDAPGSPPKDEYERADDVLEAFWTAPENKRALTAPQAQKIKSTELQLDGEVFFALFDGPGADGGDPTRETALSITDIDPDEIVAIIPKRDNKKMPLWYERRYTPQVYDFAGNRWVNQEEVIEYYQDWEVEPEEGDPQPPAALVREARIMHVTVNRISRQQRGVSEVRRVLEWSKGFHEFMQGRLAIARALQKIAQRVTVDGGAKEVEKLMQQFAAGDSLALTRTPVNGDPAVGSVLPQAGTAFMSPNVNMEPMSFETGAATAATDKASFLGMLAAGTGWPSHYLGGEGAQSLSNLTALEMPLLKKVEERQELWEGVFMDLSKEALRRAEIDERIVPEVAMPPILQRDMAAIAAASAQIMTAVDPKAGNIALRRVILADWFEALGKPRIPELIEEIFPEDYEDPPDPQALAAAAGGGQAEADTTALNGNSSPNALLAATLRHEKFFQGGGRVRTLAKQATRNADPARGVPDANGRPQ